MPLITTDTAPASIVADPKAAPENKTFKKAKKNDKVLRRSMINFQNASSRSRKQLNVLWGKASQCPLWKQKRIPKIDKKTGKALPLPVNPITKKAITMRGNRVLSQSTLRTLASGAAATMGAIVHAESRELRCDTMAEDARYPMLPPFGVGTSMATEAALVAYIQEIFNTAVEIKDAVKIHKKVTTNLMRIAADLVNAKIAAATSFVPPSVPIRGKPKKVVVVEKKGAESAESP